MGDEGPRIERRDNSHREQRSQQYVVGSLISVGETYLSVDWRRAADFLEQRVTPHNATGRCFVLSSL